MASVRRRGGEELGGTVTASVITPSVVVTRSPDLVTAPVGDDLVMMDVESGTFYVLDDIGSFIWEGLAGAKLVADLLANVQERYEVVPDQCETDVLALLEQMHDSRLIRVGD